MGRQRDRARTGPGWWRGWGWGVGLGWGVQRARTGLWVWWLLAAAVAAPMALRVLGASDIGQNSDQSKTMAFTADMVINGEWALPRDGRGDRTLKPPLINWLAAPLYAAWLWAGGGAGGWAGGGVPEWVIKAPAPPLAAGLMATVAMAGLALYRRLDRDGADGVDRALGKVAAPLGAAAAAAWLASNDGLKHAYFLRPDIAQAAALTMGWAAATVALRVAPARLRGRWLAGAWAAAGLAGLAKGPLAILVPMYMVLLAACPVGGDGRHGDRGEGGASRVWWRRVAGLGWWYGPVLMVLPVGAWLLAGLGADRAHVIDNLLGIELMGRVEYSSTGSDPWRVVRSVGRVPAFMFERFSPWALLGLIGLIAIGQGVWRGGHKTGSDFGPGAGRGGGWGAVWAHPLTPAAIWVGLVMAVNVFTAGGSGSPLFPAYGPLALLGVYGLSRLVAGVSGRRAGLAAPVAGGLALVVGVVVGLREGVVIPGFEGLASRGARSSEGERLESFAGAALSIVGDDGVAYLGVGLSPVPTLMGRVRPGEPDDVTIARGDWVIMPRSRGAGEALIEMDGEPWLALYRVGGGIDKARR